MIGVRVYQQGQWCCERGAAACDVLALVAARALTQCHAGSPANKLAGAKNWALAAARRRALMSQGCNSGALLSPRRAPIQAQSGGSAMLTSRSVRKSNNCYGWAALANISADDARNAANARAAGAIEAAVATLKRRPPKASVLGSACSALSALLTDQCTDAAADAGAAGAVKAVVAALRLFPDDVRLQCSGCAALAGLLHAADNRRRAFDSGVGEAAIAAMRTHAADQQVQAQGCTALGNLFCYGSQAGEHAQLVAGAITMVISAMTAHASDGNLQRRACDALSSVVLGLRNQGKAAVAAAGGIQASVAALRAHADDAEMQTAGCKALSLMCAGMPGHQAKAVAAGGIEAVVQALRRHAADAELQQFGCTALAFIVQNSRGSVQRANAAGALDAVVAAATGAAAATPGVFDAACIAFLELVPGHETAAVLAGALEALEQRAATDDESEASRSRLIQQLQPAAHDAVMLSTRRCRKLAATRLETSARICQDIRRKRSRLAASRQSFKRSVDTLLTQKCSELDAPRWLTWSRTAEAACSEQMLQGHLMPLSPRRRVQLRRLQACLMPCAARYMNSCPDTRLPLSVLVRWRRWNRGRQQTTETRLCAGA
jgi:hypothetical protein